MPEQTLEKMALEDALAAIRPVDTADTARAWKRWDSIAKPLRSLGLLEEAVVRLAGMRRGCAVSAERPCVVVMCADNGVVDEGVTQTDREVTAIVTENFTKGTTSMCAMARVAGAHVVPVDVGVYRDVAAKGLLVRKVAYGTKNMAKEPAMTREQAVQAIETGIDVVRMLAAQGYDVFATGEMGIGNTTTSSAITAVLLGASVQDVTGRGAGLSSEGLRRKVDAIERAIAVNCPNPDDVLDVLAKVGGFDVAGLVGVYLGGALCGVPVLLDGFISSVAALCAVRLCPAAADYMLASHVSNEPAGGLLLHALGLKPFLTCGMCLGEGSGAVAAMPILKMACHVYNEMSTFGETEIEEYKPLA